MGIPVGWNIVRDEPKDKDVDVLRADVTGSRSPIRRRARGSRPSRALGAFDLADAHTARFASVLEHAPRLSHARTQLPPPAPPVPELRERDFDREELQPRPLSLSLSLDREHPLPALTPGFAPAGPRSPSSRYGEAPLQAEAARPPRLPPTASPSRSQSRRRIELDDLAEHALPPLPRPMLSWTSDQRPAPYARPSRRGRTNAYPSDDDDNQDTPRSTNAVSHPPLRRVGHRRIADGPLPSSSLRESWSPVSTVDGLGDRERSNSVSSTSSNLPWQTFLTTVVPDPVPPTAESSFASSAASASFAASSSRASSSNSNSAASEHTHLTIPSRRPSPGLLPRRAEDMSENFARACESSDEGDSTASDTEDEAAANPLSRRRIRPSYFADEPPSPRQYSRRVMDQGSDARRYVRSYYSDATSHGASYGLDGLRDAQVDGPVDGPVDGLIDQPIRDEREAEADSFATVVDDDAGQSTSPASPLDQELRDARSLLERLTRRGDIGEDFWASVGLTRSFADGVERVQERGRF